MGNSLFGYQHLFFEPIEAVVAPLEERPNNRIGRHTREYLWTRTDVIVLGNKPVERGGIPGTFYRIPTDLKSWELVHTAGGPGAIASGTKFDNTLTDAVWKSLNDE